MGQDSADDEPASKRVVLVTHESFVLPKKLEKQFEQESGYQLVVRASGDAGVLTNKLVLTKDDPLGDVTFGVDNTFASRAVDEGVFAPYDAKLPGGADQYVLPGDDDHDLTPVDNGNVCVNVDDTWFADHDRRRRRRSTTWRPGVQRPPRDARRDHAARPAWPSCSRPSRRTADGWPTTGPS